MLRLTLTITILLIFTISGLAYRSTGHMCYCIGSPPSVDEASQFEIVIVDPDETPNQTIEGLHSYGRKVLAYINIGYAENWRDYWNTSGLQDIVHGETEYEGEYYVEYWSTLWHNIILEAVDEALSSGYDGVYLDNVDAYQAIEEISPPWAEGVDLKQAMIDLIALISGHVKSSNPEGLVYVNIGGALRDLDGGSSIAQYIDGYIREEVLYYSVDVCTNRVADPFNALIDEGYLAKGTLSGLDVNVVEFVDGWHEAVIASLFHLAAGAHLIAQPSCDPYYMNPPLRPHSINSGGGLGGRLALPT
ncbi:MAG: endo alpha-1,4 polygalactosaminidase [Desulfurococcales archaeon]|nr:endo alpha-1,4 polygalactosaminidase [Desulfurococcales archaeon]